MAFRGHAEDGAIIKHRASDPFTTTQWSVVLAAWDSSVAESRHAMALLCAKYWLPVYGYIRHRGHSVEDAQDLTQEFFARLVEKKSLQGATPERQRFRSYLLGAVRHFLANEWDKARTKKRGGDQSPLSMDFITAEGHYQLEPHHHESPDRLYERQWALGVLHHVMVGLRGEYVCSGKETFFDRLKVFLIGNGAKFSYRDVADEFGMTEGAVKVAVHRLRRRYRELLRQEVAETVAAPGDIDAELQDLLAALRI